MDREALILGSEFGGCVLSPVPVTMNRKYNDVSEMLSKRWRAEVQVQVQG